MPSKDQPPARRKKPNRSGRRTQGDPSDARRSGAGDDRAAAALVLERVLAGQSIDAASAHADLSPAATDMVYGAVRHHYSLDTAVASRLRQPLKARDRDVLALLHIGLYQLLYARVPDYAAVAATVEAARAIGKPWARGLVNAVLRGLLREPATAETDVARYNHPAWLLRMLRDNFGDRTEAILAANNSRAPMALRVNTARTTPDEYAKTLDTAEIAYRRGAFPETLILDTPLRQRDLPGFDAGSVAVQDEAAQCAAHAVALPANARILDACAAPGGKAFHLREQFPDATLTALEIDPTRADVMRVEANRLGHSLDIRVGDAASRDWSRSDDAQTDASGEPPPEPFEERFDLVLVDAPCSGTGTLRRHPDIKLLRRPGDIPKHQAQQKALVANLWPAVKVGGTLLYCTCSILAEENAAVVANFLKQTPNAEAVPPALPLGSPYDKGWQILPTTDGPDGFFFAKLQKRAN